MGVKVTKEVSVMDIIAILGATSSALFYVFEVRGDMHLLAQKQVHMEKEITRIEKKADHNDSDILERLDEQKKEAKEYRDESRDNFDKLDRKLDRLIDRELNQTGQLDFPNGVITLRKSVAT